MDIISLCRKRLACPSLVLLILAIATGTAGCGRSQPEMVEVAAGLVNTRPDSAYMILNDIDCNALDEPHKARYILTKAMVNTRLGRSLITDTLLNDAADYYLTVGDTTDWLIASQLISAYDYIKGDTDAALQRLDAMIPLIRNDGLLWDTHNHIMEFSWGAQDYPAMYAHADWLLRHTDRPEQILKYTALKGAAEYMRGNFGRAVEVFDSVIRLGIPDKVDAAVSADFFCDYAEMLDGAGRSGEALEVMRGIEADGVPVPESERISRMLSVAQFNANAGNIAGAKEYLDTLYSLTDISAFELYASVAMLRAALQYRETGHFPSELMHKVTKRIDLSHRLVGFDRQTAMESVIRLNDDKYQLTLQKQRLWILVFAIAFLLLAGAVTGYVILGRRKRRLVEAEERIDALDEMLRQTEATPAEDRNSMSRQILLRQMGIMKTFASAPTPQNRDALMKISAMGGSKGVLVDWNNMFTLIDEIFDSFYSRLLKYYPDMFSDKEIQIICLLKADFSTKEIGFLTEQSSATVYVRKSAIRKKLRAPESSDIIAYMEGQTASL